MLCVTRTSAKVVAFGCCVCSTHHQEYVPGVKKRSVRLTSPAAKRDDSGVREPAW
jgi:hypothetical protein